MIKQIKIFIKKNIPSRYLEMISHKAISITKIPHDGSVISDLFVLRLENEWETYFECLKFNSIFYPNDLSNLNKAVFCFFNKKGEFISEKEVKLSSSIKTTINLNILAKDLGITEDCLFAIFHPQKKYWINNLDSFLAERGYIGYANPNFGKIKSFVHGNLDAIARNKNNKNDILLGNFSFFKKQYRLQHILTEGNIYELFLVNPTNKMQKVKIIEETDSIKNEKESIIPSKGLFNHNIYVKKKVKTKVVIESNIYLARPVVFKIMSSSFDVFHG